VEEIVGHRKSRTPVEKLRAAGFATPDADRKYWQRFGVGAFYSTDDALTLVEAERAARRATCVDAAIARAAAKFADDHDAQHYAERAGRVAGDAWDRVNGPLGDTEKVALVEALLATFDAMGALPDPGDAHDEAVREVWQTAAKKLRAALANEVSR